ncbi:MAG: methylamine methyltransferase corrinoid protein reductive activase [Proteobacteria bacterium]|nr:methylamine methyltransferase corrinoid protein reductive activase [Pseudomonadota bacterium]
MTRLGVALDLGTSGFRGQAIDLDQDGIVLSTAVTTRHPLPGANVMDHLHFAVEVGLDRAHEIVVDAVNRVIESLRISRGDTVRLAVCGNPIQLSLFQEIEIRDLAYAGKRKLEALGVVPPKRDAQKLKAQEIRGLDLPKEAEVLIPPAVRHEIGADALAMMIQTGMLEKDEIAITTDYGTNAEMALIVKGIVYTGSTAAGPALEGQQIEDGLLALPGAISDVDFEPQDEVKAGPPTPPASDQPIKGQLKTQILDNDMMPRPGDTVDPVTGKVIEKGELIAEGITGTGVVAVISQGTGSSLIRLPRIKTSDSSIHLPNGIKFTEKDLAEAGKAIGAVRAGHLTLCHEAGIRLEDIETAYMSGASGTYVDALKAKEIGMIPLGVKKIYQVGNTSLAMAKDMVRDLDTLWHMKRIADELRQHHCMFAESKVFERVYVLELSYWTEGMPIGQYQDFLKKFKLPLLDEISSTPKVIKTVDRDIPDLGLSGLEVISDIGERKTIVFEGCVGCAACVEECPEKALQLAERGEDFSITIDLALCDGLACQRCERVCPEKVFDLVKLFISKGLTHKEDVLGQNRTALDDMMITSLKKVKGIVGVHPFSDPDRAKILTIEQEAEEKGLMGLGKVVNTGIREVLNCDFIYVGLTSMDFDWGCSPTLVLKKGEEVVGEEVRDEKAIQRLSGLENVWFMHDNFVVYKDKVDFPRDIIKKTCQFEIPALPARWRLPDDDSLQSPSIIYANPAIPSDLYLKKRYFSGLDEKGLGTILVGVNLSPVKT